MDEAEVLFTKTFIRAQNRISIIYSFRNVASKGLPYATASVFEEWKNFSHKLASDSDAERLFVDKKAFEGIGGIKGLSDKLTEQSVRNFEVAVDAASLVFAHSVLDDTALGFCRVTASLSPTDWEIFVTKKKVSLEDLKVYSCYAEILKSGVDDHLKELEKDSLLRKIDRLFQVCKPPAGFSPMRNYEYNRDRLANLDNLRHEIIHGDGPVKELPKGEEDIEYLMKTNMFLLCLVNERYQVKINPMYLFS